MEQYGFHEAVNPARMVNMAKDLDQKILEAMEGEDPNQLRAACLLAGVLGVKQAERGLLKALEHKAWQVQAEAAKALGRLGQKGAVPYLRRILGASEKDLRQKMLAAASAGAEEAPKGDRHPEVQKQAAIALNRLVPDAAQQALSAALGSDQPNLISAALAGLVKLQATDDHDRVVELLSNSQSQVRAAAAISAGRLRISQAAPVLLKLLGDQEAEVRKEAVIALNHLKVNEAIEPLAGLMADADAEVRRVAAIALGNTRSKKPEVLDPLLNGLDDSDFGVRKASLSALANLRAQQALKAAAMLLDDHHPEVARQAAVTVIQLGLVSERPDYGD